MKRDDIFLQNFGLGRIFERNSWILMQNVDYFILSDIFLSSVKLYATPIKSRIKPLIFYIYTAKNSYTFVKRIDESLWQVNKKTNG